MKLSGKYLVIPSPQDRVHGLHIPGFSPLSLYNDTSVQGAHTVIQRLNDAFDGEWCFDIVSHDVLQDEVLVLGKLTAGTICKTQFGTSSITRNKNTGEVISLGDDLKAAATDALKKAATLLGVGLSLYSGNGQHNSADRQIPVNGKQGIPVNRPGSVQVPNYPQNNYSGNYSGPSNDNSKRLSSKQLGYLNNIAKDLAITQQELNNLAIQKFGTQVGFLSKKDASLFINELISAQNAA